MDTNTSIDLSKVLFASGTLAGMIQATAGNNEANTDTAQFVSGYASVDKTQKPSVDDWVNALENLGTEIVKALPAKTYTDDLLKMLGDAKDAILDGDHGKGAALIGKLITLYGDIRAIAKDVKEEEKQEGEKK